MKKIIALILVLVVALAVFSACSKKEAKEETGKMSITIINKTGETAKDISIKERIGSQHQKWENGELANDQEITMTIETVLDNGAPALDFSYAVGEGKSFLGGIIMKGDQTITLKIAEDGTLDADIVAK